LIWRGKREIVGRTAERENYDAARIGRGREFRRRCSQQKTVDRGSVKEFEGRNIGPRPSGGNPVCRFRKGRVK